MDKTCAACAAGNGGIGCESRLAMLKTAISVDEALHHYYALKCQLETVSDDCPLSREEREKMLREAEEALDRICKLLSQ